MAENTTEPPVRVSGEERPHPALRKLGRACIALVHWQRQQRGEGESAAVPDEPAAPGATAPTSAPGDDTLAPGRQHGHDDHAQDGRERGRP